MNKLILSQFISSNSRQLTRNYAFKSDLKIKWVRPEKILSIKPVKSGDIGAFPAIDKNEYLLEFQKSKELETADEPVQRLFTLSNNREKKMTEYYANSLVDLVKRHDLDYGSMESKLAEMTAKIRRLQIVTEECPRNKRMKVGLKELIDKRKKFLTKLRRWDYKRFEWILEKLDLVYKAYPSYYHWVTRKESLTKLTNIHCEDIKNERLTAYRKQLESQQIDFLQNKLNNLEFIRKEQIELAVPVTVSSEDIKEVASKLKELIEKSDDKSVEKLVRGK